MSCLSAISERRPPPPPPPPRPPPPRPPPPRPPPPAAAPPAPGGTVDQRIAQFIRPMPACAGRVGDLELHVARHAVAQVVVDDRVTRRIGADEGELAARVLRLHAQPLCGDAILE